MIPEAGLTISKRTQCTVGCHVFVTTGVRASDMGDLVGQTCDCGLMRVNEWFEVVENKPRKVDDDDD
jgi:hypothetical protein